MNFGLLQGFSKKEQARITTHLKKLFKYLQLNRTIVVGGLAIRYHMTQAGIEYPKRPFNDLDLVASSAGVVSSNVKNDFLIYHYHKTSKDFFIALVDPESKTKVDVFDNRMWPRKVVGVQFEGREMLVQSVEDQLVKTILDIQRISEAAKVDPKQFSDARLLMKIAKMDEAEEIWQWRGFEKYPKSLVGAVERAEKIKLEHPEWVKEKPFRRSKLFKCPGCVEVPGFPIVPMEQVYRVLGYVE